MSEATIASDAMSLTPEQMLELATNDYLTSLKELNELEALLASKRKRFEEALAEYRVEVLGGAK